MATAPDGTWLASAGDQFVRVRDRISGEQLTSFEHLTSRALAITDRPGRIGVWAK